jgi:hypothetical protein
MGNCLLMTTPTKARKGGIFELRFYEDARGLLVTTPTKASSPLERGRGGSAVAGGCN